MKFDQYNIHSSIKENIKGLGYKKPTDIQFRAIPAVLKGEDVLAIAQTGTGKTAAFVIPVLDKLIHFKNKGAPRVRALVLAPTHELADQISNSFQSLGKHTKIKTFCLYGGVDQEPQIEKLRKGVDVIVATPGRMFDLVSQGELDLKQVEILVLDEADHMLDLGFIKDIRDLMKHIPKKRQTLFFSATINSEIKKLAYSLVSKAIRIQISPKDPVAKNITHAVAFIEMDDKRFFLEGFVNNHPEEKILVFVRTKVRAERVKSAMDRVDINAETIHGDKEQKERDDTLRSFRTGDLKIMITTDVSARGIDIPDVAYVINYDMPDTLEHYVHRVGRTGRGRAKGQAISFCSKEEKELLSAIEEHLEKEIERLHISKGEYQNTLEFSTDKIHDLKSLLDEEEQSKDIKSKRGWRKNKW